MYNFGLVRQADSIAMPLVGFEHGADRRLSSLRGIVVVLANVALIVSLASRTFDAAVYQHPSLHSQFASSQVQHRDRDASGWVPPTVGLFLLWGAAASTPVEPTEKLYVRRPCQSLYNRPPPLA